MSEFWLALSLPHSDTTYYENNKMPEKPWHWLMPRVQLSRSEFPIVAMKQTRYITTTIQAGNRLEIDLPNLPIGQTVEVILIIPSFSESPSQVIDRKSFLKLPIEERNRILEQQAEAALPYYQENQAEWQEWVNLDIAETYAS
jgi:hypothetical protein